MAGVLNTHSLTFDGDVYVSSGVGGLLRGCCPSTVPRLVISVWVNSIKRPPVRSFAHILKEAWEGLLPSLTNGNSPASVEVEVRIGRIKAPTSHSLPRRVSSGFIMPMLTSRDCAGYTSAAFRKPTKEVCEKNLLCVAAVACDYELSPIIRDSGNGEFGESLSDSVVFPYVRSCH